MSTFHVSLDVPDLDRAVAFYRGLLGVEPAKERPGYAKFELADPPVALALQQAGRSGVSHLGVRVEDPRDVEAASARLREGGLGTFDERDTSCCYARQDKVWVVDPAGNRWEIYAVLGDSETNDAATGLLPGGASGRADSCCSQTTVAEAGEPAGCCAA